MEDPIKIHDLGYPYVWKHPYGLLNQTISPSKSIATPWLYYVVFIGHGALQGRRFKFSMRRTLIVK